MKSKIRQVAILTFLFFSGCTKNNVEEIIVIPDRQTFSDVKYGTQSNAQKSDIYLPASKPPFPVLVWIHGGGWVQGDKATFKAQPMLEALLSRGYAVVSINYRLSGEAKFPAQIYDVKAAIRWIKANSTTYKFNPDKIGVWGSSAGGHLKVLLATTNNVASLENLTQGNASQSSKIQVAIDWFGPTDFLLMDKMTVEQKCGAGTHNSASSPESALMGFPIQSQPQLTSVTNPAKYVSNDDPPMYIQHGRIDCTVPYNQSQLLYDSLITKKPKTEIKLKILEKSGHGGNEFETATNVKEMIDFLDIYLK
jgi:acetyl esterase/lipase